MTDQFSVGDTLTPWAIASISPGAMKRMAVVLNDPNKIHLDAEAVRAVGLGDRVINQGPSNCGYVMNMLKANFRDGELRTFKVRFLANVLGGDQVRAAGSVISVTDESDGRLFECAVSLEVDGRGPALEGLAHMFVANPSS
jgi:acyl dehydratase